MTGSGKNNPMLTFVSMTSGMTSVWQAGALRGGERPLEGVAEDEKKSPLIGGDEFRLKRGGFLPHQIKNESRGP